MKDDFREHFSPLRRAGRTSLVSQMLEIQDCQIRQQSIDYWKSFTCLSTQSGESTSAESKEARKVLYRLNSSIADGDYVAISYRWSKGRQKCSYQIVAGQGRKQKPSQVSDAVMDRVVNYVTHFGLSTFWIDQECIDQEDSHAKENAIQSMDLVYRCSKHPLGILSKPLLRKSQLNLLHQMLSEKFVVIKDRGPQLAHWVKFRKARKLLNLLVYLMEDPWWKRRWIFQEEYCSSDKMQLLIPTVSGIMNDKVQTTLGDVPGEVLIKAAEFRKVVTLFCLACSTSIFRAGIDKKMCLYVLRRARTYRLLQKYWWMSGDDSLGRAMSTRIVGDISRRAAKNPEDTLVIVANCCGYPVRLDSRKVKATSTSLSVAIIALLLLNGEIIWNDQRAVAAGNVFDLLKELSFNEFDPPVDQKKLTFMKKCRLVNVRLNREGLKTTGYLWHVCKEVRTKDLRLKHYQHAHSNHEAYLHRLAAKLERSYPELAHNIYRCQNQTDLKPWNQHGLREIFKLMVSILDRAILTGKNLLVAQLVGSPQKWALFVSQRRFDSPQFVFTAHESAEYSEVVRKYRSPVKYVSLSVSTTTFTAEGLPRLQTRGWLNGLAFPDNVSPKDVIFPWPAAMEKLSTS